MKQDLKDLINAMQRGWDKYPLNTSIGTKQKIGNKIGLCPLAHALIGAGIDIDSVARYLFKSRIIFPVLQLQKVLSCDGQYFRLDTIIIHLADDYNWSTPRIIDWLKSHLKD